MQLSLQSVSALFPQNRALVMSTLSGAFQAASSVFLIMDTVHRTTNTPRRTLLFVYAAFLLLATVVCILIWPAKPFGVKKVEASGAGSGSAMHEAPAVVPLSKRSFRQQALSAEYLLMVFYFSLAVLQAQFLVGTVGTQFELMGDGSDTMTRIFSLCFSLSWTTTPFIGHIIDRLGVPTALALMNTLLLCCPMLLMSKLLALQPVLSVIYALARVSIGSVYFSFMGSVFGFANFGKLAGFGLLVASCLSLLQYVLLTVTLESFHRDFFYVNAFFVLLSGLMYPLIAALRHHLRKPHHSACQAPAKEVVCKDLEQGRTANGAKDDKTTAEELEKSTTPAEETTAAV